MKMVATRVGLSYSLAAQYFGSYRSMYSILNHSGTIVLAARQERNPSLSQEPQRGPLVQFARFVNSQLVVFSAHTRELEYVAISHVWGRAEWLHVPSIQGDLLVSKQKAKFISESLPRLLNGLAFWMDVVTVNQRNRTEVSAVVQFIPDIFRDAARTLVVRECDGLYNCCAKVVDGFENRQDFAQTLAKHAWEHYKHKYDESYLQRLWTLQECLLSHTLQFVLCGPNDPVSMDDAKLGTANLFDGVNNLERIDDALYVLALLFAGYKGITNFIRAYIFGGLVSREKPPRPTVHDSIHSGLFDSLSMASLRVATKPRDYILATMPQFPWYQLPKNVKSLNFNDLFSDLCSQASASGHGFAYRFTSSLTSSEACHDPAQAWEPSKEQPEPACLGDFIKLIGNKLSNRSATLENAHLTMKVKAEQVSTEDPNHVLQMIESAMLFSRHLWTLSHKSGELSKYGSFPENDWLFDENEEIGDPADDPGGLYGKDRWVYPYPWDDYLEPRPKITVLMQSMRILDQFWSSQAQVTKNHAQNGEWKYFRRQMEGKWTQPVLRTMLLLAAMVSCKIGLSAYAWADEHFCPVVVDFRGTNVLALASKHAFQCDAAKTLHLWSVGRHMTLNYAIDSHLQTYNIVDDDRGSFGTDLLLVHPQTRASVGLLPDFLSSFQTPEETSTNLLLLYGDLVRDVGVGHRFVKIDPLEDVT